MDQDEALRMIAGCAVIAGMALGYWVNTWWYLFVVFVVALFLVYFHFYLLKYENIVQ